MIDWKSFCYDDVKKDIVLQNEMFPTRGYIMLKEKPSNGIGSGGAHTGPVSGPVWPCAVCLEQGIHPWLQHIQETESNDRGQVSW